MDLRKLSTLDALTQRLTVMTARIETRREGVSLHRERLELMELIGRERVGQVSQVVHMPGTRYSA